MQQEAALWGASEAIYFPDTYKDRSAFIENDKYHLRWEDLLAKIRRIIPEVLVSISQAMQQNLPHPGERGGSVEVFYEDFSYLPFPSDSVAWHREAARQKTFVEGVVDRGLAGAEALLNPLPVAQRRRWYAHLVDQSDTDHIYDLIHENLHSDFQLNHTGSFVAVCAAGLPENLLVLLPQHQEETRFMTGGNLWTVLQDARLTPFLEQATRMEMLADADGRRYIGLRFKQTQSAPEEPAFPAAEKAPLDLEADAHQPDNLYGREEALEACWQLVHSGKDPARAVAYADGGKAFLDAAIQECIHGNPPLPAEAYGERLALLLPGYNIPAAAYAWAGLYEKAWATDRCYLHTPELWKVLKPSLAPYLELLIARNQTEHLAWIFSSEEFRNFFLPHYEAWVSLHLDPHYPLTRMQEVVPIFNRVQRVPPAAL